jgi:hypothetical protein
MTFNNLIQKKNIEIVQNHVKNLTESKQSNLSFSSTD